MMQSADARAEPLPLAGIRVLDLTRALAGPFCTMILADLGAEVIKVEPTPAGDMMRGWGPFDRGVSLYYLSGNRNKRGFALDFRHPRAPEVLRRMVRGCDVVAENFRSGTMERMGLGCDALRAADPRLVYVSITGFGRDGPAGDRPGFDGLAQGHSGLMSVTGTEESGPLRVGVAIGDQTAGMWAAIGVLGALMARRTTGRGQRVETSLLASLVGLMSVQGQRYLSLGEVPGRLGNAHPVIAPYGVFATADGPISIAPATPDMWNRLCDALEMPEALSDPRFADNTLRGQNRDALTAIIESRLARRGRAYWIERLLAADIPAGPINDLADVFADPQVRHCGLVEQVAHATLGTLQQVGNPIRMESLADGSIRSAPPALGEHTRQVLEDLGWSTAEIDVLVAERVVLQG